MRFLRVILGALFALVAMVAALFAAAIVLIMALLSPLTGGKVRGKVHVNRGPARPAPPGPEVAGRQGDVIDVEATRVPEKRLGG
ncbi:MAG TPA: hypothetical protein VEB66_03470 [Opitutaceae bacterium]|nr:hypothetical protein [Opitutaceae bacterium]